MALRIVSFGWRYGDPHQDRGIHVPRLIVDCRRDFTRNPWREVGLRLLPGTDPRVQAYLDMDPLSRLAIAKYRELLPYCPGELWIGCQGGRHRSVYLAERIGRETGVEVEHRDMGRQEPGE